VLYGYISFHTDTESYAYTYIKLVEVENLTIKVKELFEAVNLRKEHFAFATNL
jgi:hypothetical protein